MGTTIQLNEQCKTEGSNIQYQKKKRDGDTNDPTYSRFAYVNAKGEKSDYNDRGAFIKGKHSDRCPGGSIMVTEDQFHAPKNSGYYADKKPFCNLVPKRNPSQPTPNSYPDEAYPTEQRRRGGQNRETNELSQYKPHYKLDRKFNRSSNVKPDFSLGTDKTRDDWNTVTSMGDSPYGIKGGKRVTYGNEIENVANMPFLKEATSEFSRLNTGIYMRMILWFVLLCILLMIIVKVRSSNVSMSSFGSSTSSVLSGSASSGVVI